MYICVLCMPLLPLLDFEILKKKTISAETKYALKYKTEVTTKIRSHVFMLLFISTKYNLN